MDASTHADRERGGPDDNHDRTLDWLDRDAYPFETRCIGLNAGAVHYVDEGEGTPVVMLHGNPTWSFLYRHLIRGLRDEYRCIAPDHLGFGLSERPPDFSYRPEDQAAAFAEFVERLDLWDLVLIVHDWGGPIGLSYALDHPENVRAVVVQNTWMWPVDDVRSYRLFSRLAGGFVGRRLCERYNAFARWLMPRAFADRENFPESVHRQYLEPLADPGDRTGTWVFPRAIVGSTPWLSTLWDRRHALADVPALLLWGTEDAAFGAEERRVFEALFRDVRTVTLAGVGHYVAEEAGPGLVDPVRAFLRELDERDE